MAITVKQLAELKVTEWLTAGVKYEDMPALSDKFICSNGGRTAWLRRHVRGFVAQELAARQRRAEERAGHERWLATLPEIEPGTRVEYTKTNAGRCWRFYRNVEDILVGRSGYGKPIYKRDLPEGATAADALAVWKSKAAIAGN